MGDMRADQVRQILLDLLDRTAQEHALLVRFAECVIALRSNSVHLVDKLRRYYADFLTDQALPDMVVTALENDPVVPDAPWIIKQPEPGKTKIKEEYLDVDGGRIVRKRLTGMLFFFDHELHLAVGPCTANDNQIVNFINSRFIQWMLDRGCLLCHAAGVSLKGKGLALAGFSGMGKSTLALHMMSRGLDFVSNDRLLIRARENGLEMFGVAKLPRINPGTIMGNMFLAGILKDDQRAAYARMDPQELWALEEKHDVYLDEHFGAGKFLISARMCGLVILNWKRKYPRTSLEIADLRGRPDLLATVIKAPGLFFLPAGSPSAATGYDFSDAAFLSLLQQCTVFEVSGGVNFASVGEACIHYLEQQ